MTDFKIVYIGVTKHPLKTSETSEMKQTDWRPIFLDDVAVRLVKIWYRKTNWYWYPSVLIPTDTPHTPQHSIPKLQSHQWTPWKSKTKQRMFFRMIHVKDSRSYHGAKFGPNGLPGDPQTQSIHTLCLRRSLSFGCLGISKTHLKLNCLKSSFRKGISFMGPRDPGSPCQKMSKGCTITSETKGI